MAYLRTLAAPASLPAGQGNASVWSPDGRFHLVGSSSSPYADMYARTGSGGGGVVDQTRYETNAGGAYTTGGVRIVDFEDAVEDLNANVTTGASWQYYCPTDGILQIRFKLAWQQLATHTTQVDVYVGGALKKTMYATADTAEEHNQGGASFPVTAADLVDVRITISANDSLTTTAADNWVEITLFDRIAMTAVAGFPPTNPPGGVFCAAFSPDSQFLVCGGLTSPYTTFYQRTGTVAWSTKLTDLAGGDIPAGSVLGAAYDPTGEFLLMAHLTSPYWGIWQRSGTSHARFYTPTGGEIPAGGGYACAWHPSGKWFAVGIISTPFIYIYSWDSATPGVTLLAAPSTLPTGQVKGVQFSPDGQYLLVTHLTTPFMTVYQTGSTQPALAAPVIAARPPGGS